VHRLTKDGCWHARRRRTRDGYDAGRSRLPIDGGKLSEEFASADIPEYHFTATAAADEGTDDAADYEENVCTALPITEDLLLGLVSAPKALRVQPMRFVIGQVTKERDVPQCFQLSRHGSCFSQARALLGQAERSLQVADGDRCHGPSGDGLGTTVTDRQKAQRCKIIYGEHHEYAIMIIIIMKCA